METLTEEKTVKKGNPNFGKKAETTTGDWRFKLVNSYDYLKPKDAKTGLIESNPYPDIYIAANAGVAVDPKTGDFRHWRYLFGFKSIWVDEQETATSKPTKNQIFSEKNDIIFTKGFLRFPKSNKALYEALTINDAFSGNTNPVNDTPKVYELIDEQKQIQGIRNSADLAFEAESLARTCTVEEMLPIAQLYGFDTTQEPENIRTQFILASKNNPKQFLENFNNPKFKVKYVITASLQKGLISAVENKLVYNESGNTLFQVNSSGDVAEQIANKVLDGDAIAIKLLEQLKANQG